MSRELASFDVDERYFYRRGRPIHVLGALSLMFMPAAFALREPPFYVVSAISAVLVIGLAIHAAADNGKGVGLTVYKHGIQCGSFFLPRDEIQAIYDTRVSGDEYRVVIVAPLRRARVWFDASCAIVDRVIAMSAKGGARIRVKGGVVVAGPEGIVLTIDKERSDIEWEELAAIEPHPRGFVLRTNMGARVFRTISRFASQADRIELAGFIARIRSLRTAAEGNKAARARVKAAFAGASGEAFRDHAPAREDLWRVVEGGGVPLEMRMQAAELLAEDATIDERTRFLVASHGATGHALVMTLQKHAYGDEDGEQPGERRIGEAGPWAWNDNWEEEES